MLIGLWIWLSSGSINFVDSMTTLQRGNIPHRRRAMAENSLAGTKTISGSSFSGYSGATTVGTMTPTVTLSSAVATISSNPKPNESLAGERFCEPYDSVQPDDCNYHIQMLDDLNSGQDEWVDGVQCFIIFETTSNAISWTTVWDWREEKDLLKASPMAMIDVPAIPLAHITSIKTHWTYSLHGLDLKARSGFNLTFIDPVEVTTGMTSYQIRIWLDKSGSFPEAPEQDTNKIGRIVFEDGTAFDQWQMTDIGGGVITWWYIMDTGPAEWLDGWRRSWDNDLMPFIENIDENSLPRDQRLVQISAGLLTYTGEAASFETSDYFVSINS